MTETLEILQAISYLSDKLDKLTTTATKTNETVKRIDARLRHVESTINEIAVTVGVDSRGISNLRTDVEELDRRVSKLENA